MKYWGQRGALLIFLGVIFALSIHQLPQYSSNQNTYFLSGLANAGFGALSQDRLAHQTDTMPVFSALVSWMVSLGLQGAFPAIFAVLALVYFGSLAALAGQGRQRPPSTAWLLAFCAVMILLHNGWVFGLVGAKLPAVSSVANPVSLVFDGLTEGVAGQYVLGHMLQPSVFGVLLVLGLALFVHGHDHWAVLACVSAATLHPTYALHAGILVAAFSCRVWLEAGLRQAVTLAGWGAVLISPIAWYVATHVRPTNAEALLLAQDILVHTRIPHHADPSVWFGMAAVLKLLWVLLAVVVSRGLDRRLFHVLGVSIGIVLVLTLAQQWTGNLTLALMFPWRLSAWLVPVSTAVIFGACLRRWGGLEGEAASVVHGSGRHLPAWLLLGTLVTFALVVLNVRKSSGVPDHGVRSGVIEFARQQGTGRWAVPLDFEDFRLATGRPIVVDWKSHPYRDVEVLDWWHRVSVMRKLESGSLLSLSEACAIEPVDFWVAPMSTRPVSAEAAAGNVVYQDKHYVVRRVRCPASHEVAVNGQLPQ